MSTGVRATPFASTALRVKLRLRMSLSACVASGGCGGVRVGERRADALSAQNSKSLESTGKERRLRRGVGAEGGGEEVKDWEWGRRAGRGGEDVRVVSRSIAFPSRLVDSLRELELRLRSVGAVEDMVVVLRG